MKKKLLNNIYLVKHELCHINTANEFEYKMNKKKILVILLSNAIV